MTQTQTASEFLNKKTEMRDFIFKKFATNWNEQLMKNDFSTFNLNEQRKRQLEIGEKVTREYNSELLLYIKALRENRKEFQKEIYKLKFPDYIPGATTLNVSGLTEINTAVLFVANLPAKWTDIVRSAFDMGRTSFAMHSVDLVLSKIQNTYTENNSELFTEATQLKEEFENALGISDKTEMSIGLDVLIMDTMQFIRDINDIREVITWDAFNSCELEVLNNVNPDLYSKLRAGKYNQKMNVKQREV